MYCRNNTGIWLMGNQVESILTLKIVRILNNLGMDESRVNYINQRGRMRIDEKDKKVVRANLL